MNIFDAYIGKHLEEKLFFSFTTAKLVGKLKRRYRRKRLLNAFDMLDCNVPIQRLYDVSQLHGMVWMCAIWDQLSGDTVKNCWKHTRLLDRHDEPETQIHLTKSGILLPLKKEKRLKLL